MSTLDDVRSVLRDTLQLGDRAASLQVATPLFGTLPEFDSMAVVTVVTALEEQFDILVDDEDISAETFATVGSLCNFVDQKRAS